MWMIKWKLMLTTAPYVAGVVLVRFILEYFFHFHGAVELSDIGMVLTGGVFLIGFMLTGTLADYKESEKMPAELATTLETIEEIFDLATVGRPALDRVALRRSVLEVTSGIMDRLLRKIETDDVYEKLTALNQSIHAVEAAGASVLAGRALGELFSVRRMVARIDVISRTSFLASGYALLETVVVAVIGLVLLARFKTAVTTYTLETFVSLIFVYMLRLIKDVDDPFEYSPDGSRSGAAEVELFPLHDYQNRVARRLIDAETAPR